ncbi:hypothetical protein [Mycolicibacter terrae]|uniref:hypothetical protein n=1 Tax=Mycolicibacter terrae TaxID=1788 RepID=UPI0013009CB3|nr:hypothetical protein [Mycolicibacter terrae]
MDTPRDKGIAHLHPAQCNTSRADTWLFTHRNTVPRRFDYADELSQLCAGAGSPVDRA